MGRGLEVYGIMLNGRLIGLENKNEGFVRVDAMRIADDNDCNDESLCLL